MHAKLATAGLLAMISGVCSWVFLQYGGEMAFDASSPVEIRAFGALMLVYSVLNIALLLGAWHFIDPRIEKVSRYCALGICVAIVGSGVDEGIDSTEELGLFLALLMLFVNWLAVKRAIDSQRPPAWNRHDSL